MQHWRGSSTTCSTSRASSAGHIELRKATVDLARGDRRGAEIAQPLVERATPAARGRACPRSRCGSRRRPRASHRWSRTCLTNAAKYSPERGRISARPRARREPRSACGCSDDGIGIAPELLPRVFELFVQGETSLARPQGGLGIGLTLVRRLVELHGGRVTAHSAGPDLGSEFTVWLPLATGPPRRAAAPERLRARLRRARGEFWWSTTTSMRPRAQRSSSAPPATWRATCYDGSSALLSRLSSARRSCCSTSALPDLDGYEVARRLRELPSLSEVVIVPSPATARNPTGSAGARPASTTTSRSPSNPRRCSRWSARDDGVDRSPHSGIGRPPSAPAVCRVRGGMRRLVR